MVGPSTELWALLCGGTQYRTVGVVVWWDPVQNCERCCVCGGTQYRTVNVVCGGTQYRTVDVVWCDPVQNCGRCVV